MSGSPWQGGSPAPGTAGRAEGLEELLARVAAGDEAAFERVYGMLAPAVYGLARRVLRDPAQAEEVAQEVLVEVWRTASRYDPGRGSALSWVMTMAHHRAVDRVRSVQAAIDRDTRAAHREHRVAYDEVAEAVTTRLEGERARRCLDGLTELQRRSVELAFYGGYSYPEVAGLLKIPLGTVKTRMRDGLVRLRDCMGVER
ncbi:RNA polymerase sigma-70 factor (ECF subfamily) [Thermocatellispora tengchongensis]|uniref:RNA polymerase sigma-70 factor (ECF subfamily) n=1 Tax=Thermocatellispora tengchongensis TaxID=1073253 RepID=A0A840P7M5_9ACTN|nr:ECF RNA polymerase sigma factor SigK [Thermocatellispora tengchongensis]MBB5132015.1 RNA polymerase sigma-70 factor (ECF subfamily) [Thermocatellispora tengchongensis]